MHRNTRVNFLRNRWVSLLRNTHFTGKVNKKLVSGFVLDVHYRSLSLLPLLIAQTKLRGPPLRYTEAPRDYPVYKVTKAETGLPRAC